MVSIILVNYNTKDLTKQCISSVYRETKDVDFNIFCVDNGSEDGSPEAIMKAYPDVRLIVNSENLGFGRANNLAIEASRGEYLFLLNTDTILTNNAVKIFLEFMEDAKNDKVGCCGGQLYDLNMNPVISYGNLPSFQQVFFDVFKFKKIFKKYYLANLTITRNNLFDNPQIVGYVSGADMFLRRTVLEKIGVFDEDFFLYFEDAELSLRMIKNGFKTLFIPDVKIIHLAGQSSVDINKWEKLLLREQSRLLFFSKRYRSEVLLAIKTMYILENFKFLVTRFDKRYLKIIEIILKV